MVLGSQVRQMVVVEASDVLCSLHIDAVDLADDCFNCLGDFVLHILTGITI